MVFYVLYKKDFLVLNHKVRIKNSNQYVSNAISIYVKSVIKAIEKKDISYLEFFEYEL